MKIPSVISKTFSEFSEDEVPTMAAALAYYTVFSLPPLMVLLITILGVFLDPRDVQGQLGSQLSSLFGADTARDVQGMIRAADKAGSGGTFSTILSILALLFGATGAFSQLQSALNKAWEVTPDPEVGGVKSFLTMAVKRIFSLGMVLVIAFLFLVSLAVTTVISALGERLGGFLPDVMGTVFLHVLTFGVSFVVIMLLFAAMFKVLPDAEVPWKDVWFGAAVTAVLFVVGKFVLGFYISQSNPGEVFGAAGSLAVLLVWVYYSAMIVLLGAEFTQVWTKQKGHRIEPSKGAVRVIDDKKYVHPGESETTKDNSGADREARERGSHSSGSARRQPTTD